MSDHHDSLHEDHDDPVDDHDETVADHETVDHDEGVEDHEIVENDESVEDHEVADAALVVSPGRSWPGRLFAGRVMIAVAAVGFVTSLVGSVVAWQLLGQLDENTAESLRIGEETLVTLDATIDVADELVASVRTGLGTTASSLDAVGASLGDTAEVAEAVGQLAVEIPPSLGRIEEALGTVEQIAGTVDTTLSQLSNVPFGPDYDPDVPLDDAIAGVRADLGPIAESLESAAGTLTDFEGSTAELNRELAMLTDDIESVSAALGESAALLDDYRRSTADAIDLARSARADLDDDLSRSRLIAVVLGVTMAVGQIVPFWVGRELIETERAAESA